MPDQIQIDPQTGERIANIAPPSIDPATGERIGLAPPQNEQSTIGKLWDKATTGLISREALVNGIGKEANFYSFGQLSKLKRPGENYSQFLDRMATQPVVSPEEEQHPWLAGIRAGVAGAVRDTYGQISGLTSPVSLATIGAGAATKAPGAIGTATKAITGLSSAGFAGQGGANVADALNKPLSPESLQQGLGGAAQVVGGAAGTLETAKGLNVPGANAIAKRMYQAALKPPPGSYSLPQVNKMVETGLEKGIPVSQEGAAKLQNLINVANKEISDKISAGSASGVTVDPTAVAARADAARGRFANQVNPNADLQAIEASKQEFLKNNPNPIPAEQAQAMKVGTYRQLSGKYGELSSAATEAQKNLARGIKEELEAQFPEIKGLNAEEGRALNLQEPLERAVRRVNNHDILSLGGKIAMGGAASALAGVSGGPEAAASTAAGTAAVGILHHVMTDPTVQSRLAIALNRASKGSIPISTARTRVIGYVNALANAEAKSRNRSEPNSEGRTEGQP